MSITEPITLLRWSGGTLHLLDYCEPGAEALLAVEAWRVEDGRTLARGLHEQRFAAAQEAAGLEPDAAFWAAAQEAIPAEGAWYPRVELQQRTAGTALLLRLRPAPELRAAITLSSLVGPDPRTQPERLGPDDARLSALSQRIRLNGADDAVILGVDGLVVTALRRALLWWRDDTLCLPASELARVDSVTVRAVRAAALAAGVSVVEERCTPAELDGLEIWALSAAQGIQLVREWRGGPSVAAEPGRLEQWRRRLDALRR